MFTANKFQGRSPFFSIKGKLMLFYGIFYLVFAFSFTLLNYNSAKNSLIEALTLNMDNSIKGITTVVQTSINTAVKNYLRFNAESNYSQIEELKSSDLNIFRSDVTNLIGNIRNNREIKNYIIDSDGILQNSITGFQRGVSFWNYRDEDGKYYIQNLISKAFNLPENSVDSISYRSGNEIVISVFSFIKSINWIVISSIERSNLKSFIDVTDFRDDIVSLVSGKNGSVEIFDTKGLQIIHSAKQFEGNIRDSETHNIIMKLKNGRIDRRERIAEVSSLQYVTTSSEAQNNKMINKIYSFTYIPDMDWYIAIGVDEAEVFSSLYRIRNISIVTSLLFFLALAGMSLLVSEKVIMSNLRLLTNAIGEFEKKKFATRVEISGHDEIYTLSRSFNSMAQTIENYSIHMEKVVSERTHDLLQSEKMAALGGLVAGIAHEINTPVGIAVTASSHLKNEVEKMKAKYDLNNLSKSDLNEFLEKTEEASHIIFSSISNAGALVRRFKKIAVDQSVEEPRFFNFREYLEDVLISLNPEFQKHNIETVIECDKDLVLFSDPGYYYQIFYNYILNSLLHGYSENDKGIIYFKAHIQEGNFIFVYEDDGKGIEEKALSHIFEPFYTTKRGKGGTGLGLHIIYNLVTQTLGGSIKCESSKGVRFTITIPEDKIKKGND